jgi:hypothetical protein
MESPCELGVLADYRRVSHTLNLVNVLWEIVADRKWSPDKSTAKFLFIRFGGYFILGYNHHRTKDSIEKEHTPFKFNESRSDAAASISARGYGAKLFPLHVQGTYANLFRLVDSSTFSSDPNDWGMKDWIDITGLCRIIDYKKEEFNPEEFRSRYYTPLTKKKGKTMEKPFFLEDEYVGTPLAKFVEEHNFKYFYVFLDYASSVNVHLEDALKELARIYEDKDVELYSSDEYAAPTKIVASKGFGLVPRNWVGAVEVEWRLGEKITLTGASIKSYYKSEFRFRYHGSDTVIWGRVDSNGSATDKFGIRFASFEPPVGWTPQARVTLALTTTDYRESLGTNEEKLQEHIYLCVEDELISWREADPVLSVRLRSLPVPTRIRLKVDILEESLKTHQEGGLVVNSVKSNSTIQPQKAIHEMMLLTVSLGGKHLRRDEEAAVKGPVFYNDDFFKKMECDIHQNKKASTRSTKRKREGLKYEKAVSDYLENQLNSIEYGEESCPITWEDNDATIMAVHGLDGQGIDTLGKLVIPSLGKNIWIAVQSKDRESAVPAKELDAFSSTVQQLKDVKCALNPRDVVVSVLSLAKMKSFTYTNYEKMLEQGIITVVDSETAGVKTLMAIESMLELLL